MISVQNWQRRAGKQIEPFCIDSARLYYSCLSFQPRKIRVLLHTVETSPAYLNEAFPIQFTVANNDTVPVSLYFNGLLHPLVHPDVPSSDALGDYIQTEGAEDKSSSISNMLITDNLPAGQSTTKTFYLNAFLFPGARDMDISVTAKPAIAAGAEAQVAVTELTKHLSLDVVHPFFCDIHPVWYRPERMAKDGTTQYSTLVTPYLEPLAYRLSLEANLGALGPTSLLVQSIKLILPSEANGVRLVSDSVEEDEILAEREFGRQAYPLGIGLMCRCFSVGATRSIPRYLRVTGGCDQFHQWSFPRNHVVQSQQ